jgi:hypothetical protein
LDIECDDDKDDNEKRNPDGDQSRINRAWMHRVLLGGLHVRGDEAPVGMAGRRGSENIPRSEYPTGKCLKDAQNCSLRWKKREKSV